MKKFFALFLALIMALSLVACGGGKTEEPAKTDAPAKTEEPAKTEDKAPETVKIGFFGAVTGVNSESGRQCTLAAEAVEWYINEVKGGFSALDGAKVECVVIDSTSDPSTASRWRSITRQISGFFVKWAKTVSRELV